MPAESANTEYGASARAQWQDCERGLLVSLQSFLQKKEIFFHQYMLGGDGKEFGFQG